MHQRGRGRLQPGQGVRRRPHPSGRGAAAGPGPGGRRGRHPGGARRDRTSLRGRRGGRSGGPGRRRAPLPLADRAPLHRGPARPGAHRTDHRPGRRDGAIAGPPGEVMDHNGRMRR
ncbi:hypothetical protein SGPA1_20564 [Streptomyces misionensis JCM 4497]